jgi:hypothetical protein
MMTQQEVLSSLKRTWRLSSNCTRITTRAAVVEGWAAPDRTSADHTSLRLNPVNVKGGKVLRISMADILDVRPVRYEARRP